MGHMFQMVTDKQSLLNASFEIDEASIILHSRGGAKAQSGINTDYAAALKLLLTRLADASVEVQAAWVDSSRVQGLPIAHRVILDHQDLGVSPDEAFQRMSKRMKAVGRASNARGGNQTRRIRIKLSESLSQDEIVRVLRCVPARKDTRSLERIPAEELSKVTAEHVWLAIHRLLAGYTGHGFGPSKDFDLIGPEGSRLPPKAVFGLAASEALGFKVLPKHFSAGLGTPCFRCLEKAGFKIIPKNALAPADRVPPEPLDEGWTEGTIKWVTHLKRERAIGLAPAKKAQFLRLHGKLFCERCGMDPLIIYGTEHAESCIEVHHHKVQIQNMDEGHQTKLDDLQCLCANCHRLVHRLLKNGIAV